MDRTTDPQNSSFLAQLRRVLEDGMDYAQSQLRLLQAQITSLALSTVLFLVLIASAILTGFVAFALLSVALGIWLAHLTGSAGWSLLIIGGVYALLAIGLGGTAIRWLNNLKS